MLLHVVVVCSFSLSNSIGSLFVSVAPYTDLSQCGDLWGGSVLPGNILCRLAETCVHSCRHVPGSEAAGPEVCVRSALINAASCLKSYTGLPVLILEFAIKRLLVYYFFLILLH